MNEARYREAEGRLWASVAVTPTEARLSLDGSGTTVRVQEVGDGPPVLFVHGVTNGGTSWASLVARLDGFRRIILDRPGCGLSDPLPRRFADVQALNEFADALLVDVLDALDIETAHLVGTSFGGYFALRAAAAHPKRVRRLLELGWFLGAPAPTPFVMRLASTRVLGPLLASIPANERMVRSMFRQIGLREALAAGRVSQEMLDWYVALLRDTDTMRNEVRAGPRLIRPLRGMDHRGLLPDGLLESIRVPVAFLWGEHDPFGGAATAQALVPRIPGAQLEIMPGTGHAVWMDDPDHVAAFTRRFLTDDSAQ